jgi:low temperature requirement protein LtrA
VRNRATELLRKAGEPRATFLELFFDLVFVFAFARLSQMLIEQLSWRGALKVLVLLLALWVVWISAAGTTNRYDTQRTTIQLLVLATMFGVMVMAAAAPGAFGERGLVFAGTYVAINLGRNVLLGLMLRGHEAQRSPVRVLFWFGVSAVPWIAGAVAHGSARPALWALAVAIDYSAIALRFPTPRLGTANSAEFRFASEHFAERFRQFFIIALGEQILVMGMTLANTGFETSRIAATAVAFATTVVLWRIYISRAGGLLAEAISVARDPLRVAISGISAHVIMAAGIVAIAVGDELVIEHPFGHTPPAWIAVILGGPALFLAGRAYFGYGVFGWVPRSRPVGVLVLAAISPAMVFLPPLMVAIAATLVVAGVSVVDEVRVRRHRPKPPSPPP